MASLLRFFARAPECPPPGLAVPRVLWIELTSRCPYDCVFCSRRLRRGGGVHMDMALFRRIVGELQAPEIIRLNYAGESTHHPHVVEAIGLAARTGAVTELVTALGSLPERLVEPLATSGLDRLTISLHTLDDAQYGAIYRHGSVDAVRSRIDALRAARDRAGHRGPAIDLAVVAMRRNLHQLLPLASYAQEIGATGLAIHPVIRRDPTPDAFVDELAHDRLRPAFIAELAAAVDEVRTRHPGLPLSVSTPELDAAPACIGLRPQPWPGPLPPGARIHGCEQNPWETTHILADGSVVTCEVRDRVVLGRIAADGSGPGLAALWAGAGYAAFRAGYRAGQVPECRDCAYKTAYLPGPQVGAIEAADGAHPQLLHGWHAPDGGGLLWAKSVAALELARGAQARVLRVAGLVPAGVGRVAVQVDGVDAGVLGDGGAAAQWLDVELPLPRRRHGAAAVTVALRAARACVPARDGQGADVRELGFGLQRAAVQ